MSLPHLRHALAQAAGPQEVIRQSLELLIDQIIRLVDKAKGDVGHDSSPFPPLINLVRSGSVRRDE